MSEQHHHHGHHRDANLTAKYIKSDFLCRLNFSNKLPPIPCESKLLSLPFNPNDYDKYKLTTLELKRTFQPVIPKRTAIFARDFIDPATYTAPTNPPPTKKGKFLDIEDFELFEDTNPYKLEFDAYLAAKDAEAEKLRREAAEEAKREARRKHQKGTSAAAAGEKRASSSSGTAGGNSGSHEKAAEPKADTVEGQRAIIERSFEAAKKASLKHPDNPNARVVEVIPVFPSFELYGVDNIYVRSKANPLYDRETSAAEDRRAADTGSLATRSVIRGVTEEGRRKGEVKHFTQVLYPDAQATREASESQKIEPDEEVYTYSGFFESEFVSEKRCLGLIISENAHKNDSVPGARFVAEYLRLAATMQLQRANGVDMAGKRRFLKVGRRDMNQKEESEFEKKQEALSKPDRGNLYEMEIPAGSNGTEEDEEEEEEEDNGENFEEDEDDEYGNVKEIPSPSSSSDSE